MRETEGCNLEHCTDCGTQCMVNKSKVKMTSHLDERCNPGVIGGKGQNSLHQITKRRVYIEGDKRFRTIV